MSITSLVIYSGALWGLLADWASFGVGLLATLFILAATIQPLLALRESDSVSRTDDSALALAAAAYHARKAQQEGGEGGDSNGAQQA